MARALLIALAVLLVAGCGGEKTVAPTGPVVGTLPKAGKANPAAGKKVFADSGCAGCHTFQPAGATIADAASWARTRPPNSCRW